MRIAVDMFLHPEKAAVRFHHDTEVDIEDRGVLGKGLLAMELTEIIVDSIFHIPPGELRIARIHRSLNILRIKIFHADKASLSINLCHRIAVLVNRHNSSDAGSGSDPLVVSSECRSYMDDTGTVFGSHIIPFYHPESISVRLEPGDKLMIADTCELTSEE